MSCALCTYIHVDCNGYCVNIVHICSVSFVLLYTCISISCMFTDINKQSGDLNVYN